MGHSHGEAPPDLDIGRWPRVVVVGIVVLAGVAAAIAMLHWWPDGSRLDRVRGLVPVAADGIVIVHAELLDVRTACGQTGSGTTGSGTSGTGAPGSSGAARTGDCGSSTARLLDGDRAGRTVSVDLTKDVVGTGLRAGDHVELLDSTAVGGASTAGSSAYAFYRDDRGQPMIWLAVLFVLAVLLVAWKRGLLALLSLGFAGVVVVGYLLPALLSGQPAVPVTLAAATLMLIVMLYVTHGFSLRTSVAVAGALAGLGLSALYAWFGIVGARLGGLGDDGASLLTFNVAWVAVQPLVVASVVLAGLGTLNDVTVTQASALWELRAAAPDLSRLELFRSAMRIGRDHVASTVYTLVFAYLGTALVLLVAVQLYGGTAGDFLTSEDVAEEVVRALVGGIALVLAMPITTAIGALVVGAAIPTADDEEHEHPHAAPAGRYDANDVPWRR